jgi:DNA polymerase elongation subunit (family B)
VFFTFQLEDPENHEKIRGKKALEITIELAQEVAKLCTRFLISPMELSYEKTLMPFILLSKKRYVGMLYETDPKKGKLKFMGLSLKRRDACDYLKDVYGGVLNILMRKGDNIVQNAMDFLEKSLRALIEGNVPMDKLEITKALRSDYKNPERIGHKVLAERMGERDPGNKPKSGDRIKYVFFRHQNPKALVGERIETPEYIIENKLVIDYEYYITNQLMKPLQQLFGLALEDIWKFKGKDLAIRRFKTEMANLMKECHGDLEIFMKKKEKITSGEIKKILFDRFLMEILNKENKRRTIDSMFIRVGKP